MCQAELQGGFSSWVLGYRCQLPTLDVAELARLLDNFESVWAAGTNAQRKYLLQSVVKEVRVRDKRRIEVWYGCLLRSSPDVGG
jgi:hypothetical protein